MANTRAPAAWASCTRLNPHRPLRHGSAPTRPHAGCQVEQRLMRRHNTWPRRQRPPGPCAQAPAWPCGGRCATAARSAAAHDAHHAVAHGKALHFGPHGDHGARNLPAPWCRHRQNRHGQAPLRCNRSARLTPMEALRTSRSRAHLGDGDLARHQHFGPPGHRTRRPAWCVGCCGPFIAARVRSWVWT